MRARTIAAVLAAAAMALGHVGTVSATTPTDGWDAGAPPLYAPTIGTTEVVGADVPQPDVERSVAEGLAEPDEDRGETADAVDDPSQVAVPSIGIDAPVEPVWLNDDGTLEVPETAHRAGWWSGGASPGERGAAVIVAHVDYAGELGVFHRLVEVQPGDEIVVTGDGGEEVRFSVDRVTQVSKTDFPTDEVYDDPGRAELRLITCGGRFDRAAGSYEDNVIVFARAVD